MIKPKPGTIVLHLGFNSLTECAAGLKTGSLIGTDREGNVKDKE